MLPAQQFSKLGAREPVHNGVSLPLNSNKGSAWRSVNAETSQTVSEAVARQLA